MKQCRSWPLFFALAVGNQIFPRLRRKAALLQRTHADPDLSPGGLEQSLAAATKLPGDSQRNKTFSLPRSPPHADDVSPSDQWEKVDYAAGVASDQYRKDVQQVPKASPRTASAATCEAACLTCMQINSKSEFPSCACFATCKSGGAGNDSCESHDVSWSNEVPTAPNELWLSKCQEGRVNCDDCVSEDLIAENERCEGDILCMNTLRNRISQPVENARFCSSAEFRLVDCERFTYQPTENGWTCYTTLEDCRRKSRPPTMYEDSLAYEANPEFGPPDGELLTPCVWCETAKTKDFSKPDALQIAVDDVNVAASA